MNQHIITLLNKLLDNQVVQRRCDGEWVDLSAEGALRACADMVNLPEGHENTTTLRVKPETNVHWIPVFLGTGGETRLGYAYPDRYSAVRPVTGDRRHMSGTLRVELVVGTGQLLSAAMESLP